MKQLDSKVAIVTSSTRGIGLACAKLLAEHGAKTYLAVRRLEAGRKIAREIATVGGQADVVYFNAAEKETYHTFVEEVKDNS